VKDKFLEAEISQWQVETTKTFVQNGIATGLLYIRAIEKLFDQYITTLI